MFIEGYNDKYFLSIPGEAACDCNRNLIMGGPQPPQDASNAQHRQYKAKRKAYTNAARRKLLKNLSAMDMNFSPQKEQLDAAYTGEQSPHICLMNLVEHFPLMQGHTFGVKETLMIHSRRGQSSKHKGQGSEKLLRLYWNILDPTAPPLQPSAQFLCNDAQSGCDIDALYCPLSPAAMVCRFCPKKGSIPLNNVIGHLIYRLDVATQPDASEIGDVHNPTRFGLTTFIMLTLHGRSKWRCRSRFRGDWEQQFCDNWTFIPAKKGREVVVVFAAKCCSPSNEMSY